MTESHPPLYDYAVDAHDRIISVGETWESFARENDCGTVAAADVVGVSIWDHITGVDVRYLYRTLFEHLRASPGAVVEVPFRCDGPALRRFMSLHMQADESGAIRLRGALLRSEQRPPVALLNPAAIPADEAFLEMCSFCKRALMDEGDWVHVEVAVTRLRLFEVDRVPSLTHSVCPECVDDFHNRLALN